MCIRDRYVSVLQRPAVPYVSVGNAGSGMAQVTVCGAAQVDRSVEPVDVWRDSSNLSDTELTTTAEMFTMVSGATVLRSQLGKCSDSSGSASTVHKFVYETDATVASELLQPGQCSPPTLSQPGTQPLRQHGLPLLTSSTPPTQPPVSSESRPPALHASASQDGLRSDVSRHGSDHSQESSSTLADRRISTPMTGYSALRREAAPLSIAPSLRSHRSRRS